jgi:hypothetical protein
MANLVRSEMIPQIEMETAISNIDLNPIDVVEKLGKYQFIYDYQVPNFVINTFLPNPNIMLGGGLVNNATVTKEVATQQSITTSNVWSDAIKQVAQNVKGFPNTFNSPQPVSVNANPQVGVFSKGDIVNVIRFEGNNAIIQNPNYVEPDPNAPKVGFFSSLGDLKGQKEFMIPKEYLMKVKDNFLVTIQTGINFGANLKPQPVITVKPIYDTTLEQNATFVLTKDFQYVSGYGSSYCSPDGICTQDMVAKYSTLKAGTKVTGRLFSKYIQAFGGGMASVF